jgi:hypothetical protein
VARLSPTTQRPHVTDREGISNQGARICDSENKEQKCSGKVVTKESASFVAVPFARCSDPRCWTSIHCWTKRSRRPSRARLLHMVSAVFFLDLSPHRNNGAMFRKGQEAQVFNMGEDCHASLLRVTITLISHLGAKQSRIDWRGFSDTVSHYK